MRVGSLAPGTVRRWRSFRWTLTDTPEFRELLTGWARSQVYKAIQDGLGGAA